MKQAKTADIINQNVKFLSQSLSLKKDFFGDAPAPFVGRYNYPNINVGVLSSHAEKGEILDSPREWSKRNTPLRDIVQTRSSLINSRFPSTIQPKKERLQELAKEVGLAPKPVEVELHLKDKPMFKLQTDPYAAPRGPNADLLKGKVTRNVHVPTKIEKAHADPHLKATEALRTLYKKGVDENHLSQMLSVGVFGREKDRKLVPTRWSITATDDTLGKALTASVKEYSVVEEYELYFGGILGNYYLILFLPDVWGYELFETVMGSKQFSTDVEGYGGRKGYAENTTGGYYTVRLAILEKLKEKRKQATALAFRFVTPKYEAPLGVWVTREATRRALSKKPWTFSSKGEVMEAAVERIQDNFRFDLHEFLRRSVLLKENKEQTKLFSFTTKY